MIVLGFVLIALAGAGLVGALFLLDGQDISYFGIEVDVLTVYLAGAVSLALLLLGFRMARFGAKRELRQRREHKKLAALAAKLDRADQRERDAKGEREGDEPQPQE